MNECRISRRQWIQSAALAGAGKRAFGKDARKPNVLFLLTDDQRKDTIHAFGNAAIRTPNLDRLAQSGVSFRNSYCMGGFSDAVCLPSRMMIQRGRSWFHVREQQPGYPNFPQTMNEAGYVTYHLGKRANEDRASHQFYKYNFYIDDRADRLGGRPGKEQADRTIDFLRKWKSDPQTGEGKPFFMYLAGPSPHDPRVAPPEYLAKYDAAKIPLPRNFMPLHPFDNGDMFARDEKLAPWPRTPDEIRRHLRDYYAVITYLDEQIGRIFQALKEMGEYDNTIIVFSSDQGIAIGSHGLMGKQNLYEPSMNAPLIFAGPGISKNKSVDAFAYLFDIFPTICDFAGAKTPDSLEGKSLAPVLRGEKKEVRDTVLLAYRDDQRAVRRGPWKLIRYPKIDRTQLFNLEKDPSEMHDLALSPQQDGRIKELLAALTAQQKLYGDTLPLTVDKPTKGDVDIEFFKNEPPAPQTKA